MTVHAWLHVFTYRVVHKLMVQISVMDWFFLFRGFFFVCFFFSVLAPLPTLLYAVSKVHYKIIGRLNLCEI